MAGLMCPGHDQSSPPFACVLLFGPPGVGKGTQGKRLGAQSHLVHLATGDMFRGLDPDSDVGRKFLEYSTQGLLVPDELTVEIWRTHVQRMIDRGVYSPETDLLVLDGIPRSVNQVLLMRDYLDVKRIIHLMPSDREAVVQRIKKRAEEEGRRDDADEQVIRRRFSVYDEETAPLLREYDDGLIAEVDAMGTIDEVFERVHGLVADESLVG